MRVLGKDVALYVNSVLLGLSTSCELNIDCDISEFTSVLSGNAKRNRPGRYGWTVSCEMVEDDSDTAMPSFLSAIQQRATLTVSMEIAPPGATVPQRYYGNVCVQNCRLSGALGSMATYRVTLVGDGPLFT